MSVDLQMCNTYASLLIYSINAVNFPQIAENFRILKLYLTKDISVEKYHLKLLSL
jgi:hypothetical protein